MSEDPITEKENDTLLLSSDERAKKKSHRVKSRSSSGSRTNEELMGPILRRKKVRMNCYINILHF